MWVLNTIYGEKKTNKPFTGTPIFSGPLPKFQGSQDHFFSQVLIFLFSSFSKLPPLPCMPFLHEEIEVAMNFFMQSMVVLAQWGLASSLAAGDLFAFWDVGVQRDEIWDFSLTIWRLEVGIFHRTITCGNSAGRTHGLKCVEDLWRWIGSPKIDASYIPSPSDAPNVDAQETVPL